MAHFTNNGKKNQILLTNDSLNVLRVIWEIAELLGKATCQTRDFTELDVEGRKNCIKIGDYQKSKSLPWVLTSNTPYR